MKNEPIYIVSAEENYHYGQVIYEEGSSGDWVYVILSGLVEVSKNIGGKKYIIEILQSGDVFGVLEYIGRTKKTLPLLFSDGEKTYRAHTVDVSANGLFVVTEHLLNQGQEFLVKIQL